MDHYAILSFDKNIKKINIEYPKFFLHETNEDEKSSYLLDDVIGGICLESSSLSLGLPYYDKRGLIKNIDNEYEKIRYWKDLLFRRKKERILNSELGVLLDLDMLEYEKELENEMEMENYYMNDNHSYDLHDSQYEDYYFDDF